MDTTDYNQKLQNLTSDTDTYQQINNDPTGMLERKLRQILNDWK